MNRKNYAISALLFIAFSNNVFSQDATPDQTPPPKEFSVNKDQELTDFLVITCEGKTKKNYTKRQLNGLVKLTINQVK